MLYTKKGDDGTTRTLSNKKERISKSSCQTESLGALDELNSFLGLTKLASADLPYRLGKNEIGAIIFWVQNSLFTVQAEVAGAPNKVSASMLKKVESWIADIEKELPPIKTFLISGGTELSALLDISRTLARKAERRVIGAVEEGGVIVGKNTLAFLNRLSSLFYALARLNNHKSGINEYKPSYGS